jgi:diadenosine tetraphosphate (Ap4A) HIT family hydrolase
MRRPSGASLLWNACLVLLGVILGGYLFSDTQPRSFLALHRCEGGTCLEPNDLLGLLGSVGVRFGSSLPAISIETERSIALRHPRSHIPTHYVVIPKRDIRNAGVLGPEDGPYLVDAFAVMGDLIRRDGLTDYQILTRGPANQGVTYLHFHLMSDDRAPDETETKAGSRPAG